MPTETPRNNVAPTGLRASSGMTKLRSVPMMTGSMIARRLINSPIAVEFMRQFVQSESSGK